MRYKIIYNEINNKKGGALYDYHCRVTSKE
nr:MAG TPA: hypothetical protein [Caudoviricetes sp.]